MSMNEPWFAYGPGGATTTGEWPYVVQSESRVIARCERWEDAVRIAVEHNAALSRDRAPAGAPGDVWAAAERLLADATTQQAWVDHEGETVTRMADVLLVARHVLAVLRGAEGLAAAVESIMPYLEESLRLSEPYGHEQTDTIATVNDFALRKSDVRALRAALAARSEGT